MKNIQMTTYLLGAALIIQGCNSSQPSREADTIAHSPLSDSSMNDTAVSTVNNNSNSEIEATTFVENAAIGGLVEIEMGKLGQQMATDTKIKEFAAMLERDHTSANNQLKAMAINIGINPPATLPSMKQKHLDDLKTKTGNDFDKYYVNMMVEEHLSDIALFEGATKSPDTAIANFAARTLPVLKPALRKSKSAQ